MSSHPNFLFILYHRCFSYIIHVIFHIFKISFNSSDTFFYVTTTKSFSNAHIYKSAIDCKHVLIIYRKYIIVLFIKVIDSNVRVYSSNSKVWIFNMIHNEVQSPHQTRLKELQVIIGCFTLGTVIYTIYPFSIDCLYVIFSIILFI